MGLVLGPLTVGGQVAANDLPTNVAVTDLDLLNAQRWVVPGGAEYLNEFAVFEDDVGRFAIKVPVTHGEDQGEDEQQGNNA